MLLTLSFMLSILRWAVAHSAGAVEYIDSISVEGLDPNLRIS